MVDAAPFRGLRYDPAVAGEPATTSAPAYDDLDAFTYAAHRTSSPYTILELHTPADQHGSYRSAGEALRRWRRTGVLVPEAAPAFYRYEEHELRRGVPTVQRGVLASVALETPGPGSAVLTHEAVHPERVADRRARLETVRADLSPVFALAATGADELDARLARPPTSPPVVAMTDEANVDHRVWAVTDRDEVAAIRGALARVRVLLADGHHRYAAALAARSRHSGPGWQRILMYIATADGAEVLGVHRLVRDVGPDAVRRLRADFAFEQAPTDPRELRERLETTQGRAVGLLLRQESVTAALLRPHDEATLTARLPPDHSPAWQALDTALIDHAVLPVLGGGLVEYRPDLVRAAGEVAATAGTALFVLRPVAVRTAETLAARGEHLPPKSTYFRPKPRAGLVLRLLDEDSRPI